MDFRSVARAIQPYVSDTYDLLNAADAVVNLPSAAPRVAAPHDLLVWAALGNPTILDHVKSGNKIGAIKELRGLWLSKGGDGVGIGLKEAKEVIEDWRVWGNYTPPF